MGFSRRKGGPPLSEEMREKNRQEAAKKEKTAEERDPIDVEAGEVELSPANQEEPSGVRIAKEIGDRALDPEAGETERARVIPVSDRSKPAIPDHDRLSVIVLPDSDSASDKTKE